MKIFGFYITRTDWKTKYSIKDAWLLLREKRIAELQLKLLQQSETYTDKSGRLRFKHNGQFAPDNRSKFKQVHDQLRAEVAAGKYEPSDQVPHYDDIKKAIKLKEFGE